MFLFFPKMICQLLLGIWKACPYCNTKWWRSGGGLISGRTLGWFMSFLNTSHLIGFEWS